MKISTIKRLAALAVACVCLQGCVYRLAIQQGNIAESDDVEQVKVGMTPSQVKFLLGTPLIDDPFNADRWDYVYHQRIGRKAPKTQAFITVHFKDGVVTKIDKRDEPPLTSIDANADAEEDDTP
ncbi:MAG: outer membrane protein assembly factor BamE [Pseudomonadota bacterium]